MKIKLIIKLLILTVITYGNINSFADEAIKKIIVLGNKRIERATIESYLKLKVGDKYNAQKENEAIRNLYATSLFENINIKFASNGELIITVKETSFVSDVIFKGNSKIKTPALSKEILTKPGDSLSQASVEMDKKKILEMYKRSGRFSTNVIVKVENLENNRVKVIFDIAEGPKAGIKHIYFFGNNNYRDSELRTIILTKQSRWFRFLETNDTYDYDRIEYDKELLKEFYQSVGFVDFRVISAIAELSPTKEYFTLSYSIDEGEKYNFGSITIDNKFQNIDNLVIEKFINVKKGEVFNMKALENTAEKITEYFAGIGYPAVNVYPEIKNKNPDHTVDIKFIVEKASRVFINQIFIENNLKTEDHVIRREFKVEEGDIFNRSYIERGERNLRNLDYFEKVAITVSPTDRSDKYNINVNVDEKSTSAIGFDVGYNTNGGVFGRLSFVERNLVGTGKILNAGVQLGKKSASYNLGVTEPYFLDRELSLSGNIFSNFSGRGATLLSQGDQNYKSRAIGFKAGLGYNIKEDLSHEIDYLIKKDTLDSPSSSNSLFLSEQMGKFITSAIGHTLTYDKRDSAVLPKNGYLIRGTQEFAGLGGNNKYLKHEAEAKYYKSFINNKLTLKLSGSAGNIMGVSGKIVRISDRFNLGDYTLRGFASGGIGPREKTTDEGLGGEKYYAISTELNFPTGLPEEFNLTGAVFMDLGSVYGLGKFAKDERAANIYNDSSLRASVGFGVIWITRFAPIRLDWGFPIKKQKYDDKQTFHIKFSTHL